MRKKLIVAGVATVIGAGWLGSQYAPLGDVFFTETAKAASTPITSTVSPSSQSAATGTAASANATSSTGNNLAQMPFPAAPPAMASGVQQHSTNSGHYAKVAWKRSGQGKPASGFFFTPVDEEPVIARDAHEAKALVLNGAAGLLGTSAGDDLKLRSSEMDRQGNTYYKYQQTYKDVPVLGREVVVQTTADGEVDAVTGEYQPDLEVDTQPAVDGIAALSQALNRAGTLQGEPQVVEQPELYIHVAEDDQATLTWRSVVAYTTTDEGYRVDEVFVDAKSGGLVERLPRNFSLQRSVYTVDRECLNGYNMSQSLPGRQISRDTDSHARGAWDNAGNTYAFYQNIFERDSIDDRGMPLVSTVHALFAGQSGGCYGDNAMYLPDLKQMIYGDGGNSLSNPAGALDVVAHELTHGVTAVESNLIYQNESGAINEALSDIFGAGAESYLQSGGTLSNAPETLEESDKVWLLGEDTVRSGTFMRKMSDPAADGQSRDSYDSRYTGDQDNGGVHINSGIMNLAFYLLAHGGQHPRGKTDVTVTGIGLEDALDIYYQANTRLFTRSTTFENARFRLAQAAETLYGECSTQWAAVHQSYDAVKVPGQWTPCDTGGNDGGTDGGDDGSDGGDDGTSGGAIEIQSVRASSQYSSYYASQYLTDGTSHPWASATIWNPYQSESLILDLGQTRQVHQASFYWNGYNYAGQYNLYVWRDGQWQYVNGLSQGQPGTGQLPVDVQGRYFAVTMSYGQYGRWYVLNELVLQ
ncbi:M4 family metallopeptidase [Marinobacteraceae bacterium S3BR75-40.1]